MSEPKLISPMLDGFAIGAPISDHDGVRCYPAMKENSDNKYIVKIISIPASQVQLDALLLTGAYKDPASAMDYFNELSEGVVKEAQLLKKLAKLEGFLPYDSWQVKPMENNQLGYEVYLISSYKRSLEKFLRRNTMTHLGAVNLGLDMCAALAIARRAGHIYVDLKPTNIFISEEKGYRIGDLGFMDMASLKYASLPSKYRSAYTAPELHDALATVNTTVDTYAVGMILYQIYNNGQLPEVSTSEPLPAPANADYEIAEIILKACAPDPKDRYNDPIEMGRALVGYMQRNRVNDVPIVPPSAPMVVPATRQTTGPIMSSMGSQDAMPMYNGSHEYDETAPGEEDAVDVNFEKMSEETASMVEQADDLIAHEPPAPAVAPEPGEIKLSEPEEMQENAIQEDESAEEEETAEPASDTDNAPAEAEEKDQPAQQEIPETEMVTPPSEDPVETETNPEEKPEKEKKSKKSKKSKKKKGKGLKIFISLMLVLALLAGGAYYFYAYYYLQTIHSIDVEGSEDQMTVILDTEIDNALLTVIIADTFGNTKESKVEDNKAFFDELLPDTLYKIRVEIEGFHKLDGVANHGYPTPAETKIASFTAKTGPEDGSVVLSFAVDGPDNDEWTVIYSAEGEEEKSMNFSGHTASITGLTVGKTYTFALEPVSDLYLVGENSLEFTSSAIVVAQNLSVVDYSGGNLTVQWNAPADAVVESWAVHCYSNDGVDMTLTTAETTATFTGIDSSKEYTIEVLAAGMTEPARTSVSPNPLNLSNIQVNDEDISKLVVSWEFDGDAPANGWLVKYSIDGSESQGVVESAEASAVIQPRIPGANYVFTIHSADGSSVFSNTASYTCPNAEIFQGHGLGPAHITSKLSANMLVTPEQENWSYRDVNKNAYTSTFTSGQKASLLLHINRTFYPGHVDDTPILYVIRNAEGKVMNELTAQTSMKWNDMWDGADFHYCELDIPAIPTAAGNYTLYLYFNNLAVSTISFTVTE